MPNDARAFFEKPQESNETRLFLQFPVKIAPEAIMAPVIAIVQEAVKSETDNFQTLAAHVASALNTFFEDKQPQSSENVDWAISQGVSSYACIAFPHMTVFARQIGQPKIYIKVKAARFEISE